MVSGAKRNDGLRHVPRPHALRLSFSVYRHRMGSCQQTCLIVAKRSRGHRIHPFGRIHRCKGNFLAIAVHDQQARSTPALIPGFWRPDNKKIFSFQRPELLHRDGLNQKASVDTPSLCTIKLATLVRARA
jgi:hypothetical protein